MSARVSSALAGLVRRTNGAVRPADFDPHGPAIGGRPVSRDFISPRAHSAPSLDVASCDLSKQGLVLGPHQSPATPDTGTRIFSLRSAQKAGRSNSFDKERITCYELYAICNYFGLCQAQYELDLRVGIVHAEGGKLMLTATRMYEDMNSYVAQEARKADDAVTALSPELIVLLHLGAPLKVLRESTDPNVVLETADALQKRIMKLQPLIAEYNEEQRQDGMRQLAGAINNAKAQVLAIPEYLRHSSGLSIMLDLLLHEREPAMVARRINEVLERARELRFQIQQESQVAKAVRKDARRKTKSTVLHGLKQAKQSARSPKGGGSRPGREAQLAA